MTVLKKPLKKHHSVMKPADIETEAQREARLAAAKELHAQWWVEELTARVARCHTKLTNWTVDLQSALLNSAEHPLRTGDMAYKLAWSEASFTTAAELKVLGLMHAHAQQFREEGKTFAQVKELLIILAKTTAVEQCRKSHCSTSATGNLMESCERVVWGQLASGGWF